MESTSLPALSVALKRKKPSFFFFPTHLYSLATSYSHQARKTDCSDCDCVSKRTGAKGRGVQVLRQTNKGEPPPFVGFRRKETEQGETNCHFASLFPREGSLELVLLEQEQRERKQARRSFHRNHTQSKKQQKGKENCCACAYSVLQVLIKASFNLVH